MRVLCVLPDSSPPRLQALAEACLALSPQIALGADAVFAEIGASRRLFSEEECIQRLRKILHTLGITAKTAVASSVPAARAAARFGSLPLHALPIEALSDYLSPFAPSPLPELELFLTLGLISVGDFLKIPRREIPSRLGKRGLLAYERLLDPASGAWPRFQPEEKIAERVALDGAARINQLEPVLFLCKSALDRIFLRLHARCLQLSSLRLSLELNRFSRKAPRQLELHLPLPQGDARSVLSLLTEHVGRELERHPLEDALESLRFEVLDTAPALNPQRDFFSRAEEEREAWSSLLARFEARLGPKKAFLARPAPRLLPEASWEKTLDEAAPGIPVPSARRPLRLLDPPLPLRRQGELLLGLSAASPRWRITAFHGPERLEGEWWLGAFSRDYFEVSTESGELLWIFRGTAGGGAGSPPGLWLHGVYD